MKYALFILPFMLTACAQQMEIIPAAGQSTQQFNKDREACIQESKKYYGASGGSPTDSDVFLVCMKAKGYKEKEKF